MSAIFDAACERGKITRHCSDPNGGPDVGLSLGLGDNRLLWVGEVGEPAWSGAALGSATGWRLILYEPEMGRVLGLIDRDRAQLFIERLAATIRCAHVPTPAIA